MEVIAVGHGCYWQNRRGEGRFGSNATVVIYMGMLSICMRDILLQSDDDGAHMSSECLWGRCRFSVLNAQV